MVKRTLAVNRGVRDIQLYQVGVLGTFDGVRKPPGGCWVALKKIKIFIALNVPRRPIWSSTS